MAALLQSLEKTIAAGLAAVVLVIILFGLISGSWIRLDGNWWFDFLFRWMHIWFGILWIGILYYFNFVQTPFFAETDAAVRGGAIQKLVPRALWWFRWAALVTVISGFFILGFQEQFDGDYMKTPAGISISTGCPITSLAAYPKMASAARLKSVTRPRSSIEMMASNAVARMASQRARASAVESGAEATQLGGGGGCLAASRAV